MAGSQLKNLKAALKARGLTGQTNIKGKSKKNPKRQAKEYDREEKNRAIAEIREEFNPFEVKAARNKRRDGPPSKTADRVAVGKPGISKQIGEEQRTRAFEARKMMKNKRGGVVDKRFGERDKLLTEEEKMLERFTRERQSQSKRNTNLFNLEDDEDDGGMFGDGLTHLGQTLSLEDELDNGEDDFLTSKRFNDDDVEQQQPQRKKTKAEVMQEVIAKSKFYKQERQKAQGIMEDQIDDLDEDFEDVMSELMTTQPKKKPMEPKTDLDKEYDIRVKELQLDRRAAPTDRTKTEEEKNAEAEEKKRELEQQRLDRMNGMIELEEGEEKGVEDLDDGFWDNDNDYEEGNDEIANSDDDINLENQDQDDDFTQVLKKKNISISCPETHDALLEQVNKLNLADHPKIIKNIVKAYQPKLAEGNNQKLGQFTAVLLRHIIFLSNQDYSKNVQVFEKTQNALISILKSLSDKYNKALSEECRECINEMQARFKNDYFDGLSNGDLVFFSVIGTLFSTSDQYHLVITPSLILMNQFLEQIKFNSLKRIAFGAILIRIVLQYQRISKRYIPEAVYFFQKVLFTFIVEKKNQDKPLDFETIRLDSYELGLPKDADFSENRSSVIPLHSLSTMDEKLQSVNLKTCLLSNIMESLDVTISTVWKELPAFQEIISPIQKLLNVYALRYPGFVKAKNLLSKIEKLLKFTEHIPLALQNHRPISIPTHAPKYEENFNPDKKSYDPDRTRSEINKMKAQLKKERKFTMKEIRKDARFEARQRIDEKNKESSNYHAKMAHIVNTINTEEGAEKNKYERERKLRGGKK
ncbi:snoRNA-binding rRNA-processing protein NOP14 [Saccharomyces eubayanus]|uniref:snoRNA-binding rRNA-processing protein NOP14 n=1 Tax=Saccharomyces eubayanus TaxID=1080349 RepID=UPI0006BF7089|nr:NOP14-like protein [Saccharomyces eubayanus]KOH00225.1 NOP14-like protein [Saccharomyces eubayanus]